MPGRWRGRGARSSANACTRYGLAYSAAMRTGRIARKTADADILVEVNLDGRGTYDVSPGIGFLDHMVEQFSRHSLIVVRLKVDGDLHVDQHHTTEGSAIALSQAIAQAL